MHNLSVPTFVVTVPISSNKLLVAGCVENKELTAAKAKTSKNKIYFMISKIMTC